MSGGLLGVIAWKGKMFLSLRERKVSFDAYDSFLARRVDMKVRFENCDMMPFMASRDL